MNVYYHDFVTQIKESETTIGRNWRLIGWARGPLRNFKFADAAEVEREHEHRTWQQDFFTFIFFVHMKLWHQPPSLNFCGRDRFDALVRSAQTDRHLYNDLFLWITGSRHQSNRSISPQLHLRQHHLSNLVPSVRVANRLAWNPVRQTSAATKYSKLKIHWLVCTYFLFLSSSNLLVRSSKSTSPPLAVAPPTGTLSGTEGNSGSPISFPFACQRKRKLEGWTWRGPPLVNELQFSNE